MVFSKKSGIRTSTTSDRSSTSADYRTNAPPPSARTEQRPGIPTADAAPNPWSSQKNRAYVQVLHPIGVQHQRTTEQTLRRHLPELSSAQVSRLLMQLRTHGLLKKIGHTYKYYIRSEFNISGLQNKRSAAICQN